MIWCDLVNAAFIVGASWFTWRNVAQIWRDKDVRGVSIELFAFFAVWGAWQLYYYAGLGQWWSVVGTLPLFAGNLVWAGLAVYFRRHLVT